MCTVWTCSQPCFHVVSTIKRFRREALHSHCKLGVWETLLSPRPPHQSSQNLFLKAHTYCPHAALEVLGAVLNSAGVPAEKLACPVTTGSQGFMVDGMTWFHVDCRWYRHALDCIPCPKPKSCMEQPAKEMYASLPGVSRASGQSWVVGGQGRLVT